MSDRSHGGGKLPGVQSAGVARLRIGATFKQHVDDLAAVEHRRDHQRRLSAVAAAVDVRSAIQKGHDRRHVALEGCAGKRCLAAIVGKFRIGAVLHENPHRIGVAVIARQHQERVALLVAQVRRQAHAQQLAKLPRLPCPRMLKDALREGDGLLVQFRRCLGGSFCMARS